MRPGPLMWAMLVSGAKYQSRSLPRREAGRKPPNQGGIRGDCGEPSSSWRAGRQSAVSLDQLHWARARDRRRRDACGSRAPGVAGRRPRRREDPAQPSARRRSPGQVPGWRLAGGAGPAGRCGTRATGRRRRVGVREQPGRTANRDTGRSASHPPPAAGAGQLRAPGRRLRRPGRARCSGPARAARARHQPRAARASTGEVIWRVPSAERSPRRGQGRLIGSPAPPWPTPRRCGSSSSGRGPHGRRSR